MSSALDDAAFHEYNQILAENIKKTTGKLTKSKLPTIRTNTIRKTFTNLLQKYPNEQPGLLWRSVEEAHVKAFLRQEASTAIKNASQKTGIPEDKIIELLSNDKLIRIFESSSQSKKRSSGIAWEQFFEETFQATHSDLKVVGPRDMRKLINGEYIANSNGERYLLHFEQDKPKNYLIQILADSNFDLYLLYFSSPHRKWRLIGLVQCKTSIRERIQSNARSSVEAMNHHLWSILLAIDPDNYLKAKYSDLAKDNWHGVYLLDNEEKVSDTIFSGSYESLKSYINEHASRALQDLTENPLFIDSTWHKNRLKK